MRFICAVDDTGLPTEIEQQRRVSDIGKNIDRQKFVQIAAPFDE